MSEPFGVTLPDSFGDTSAPDNAPDTGGSPSPGESGGTVSPIDGQTTAPKTDKPEGYLDLDKLDRFRFNGREWAPKELKSAIMAHADYTKKTMEVAQNRRFADNFAIDMQSVLDDRQLWEKFKSIYPPQYVANAEKILKYLEPKPAEASNPSSSQYAQLPPEIRAKLEDHDQRWARLDKEHREKEIEGIQTWIDTQFKSLSEKYPDALPELVMARAQVMSDQGNKIDEEALDKLFKKSQTEQQTAMETRYQTKVKEQRAKGERAKDAGTGGSPPSNPPRKIGTFKEAREAMYQDLGVKI
jgi:hypothetical protein